MPEGHLVHRLARNLHPFVGRAVHASSPQGRFAAGAQAIDGAELESADAYGKHLLVGFRDEFLHIHLGRAGSMTAVDAATEAGPTVRLRLDFVGSDGAWQLVGPTICELIGPEQRAALLKRLGPDPLRSDDPEPAFARIRKRQTPIGALLLDQGIIAGAGNVFRAEILHLCRIHPDRPGASLHDDDLSCLWDTLSRLMKRAMEQGRIVTAGPDALSALESGGTGRFVYRQDNCGACGGGIKSWALGGRTAYACEACQPAA